MFFGPDTYRFVRFLKQELAWPDEPVDSLVDIGCGSGAGAIVAARAVGAPRVVMTDINPEALRLARINARAAGVAAEAVLSDVLQRCRGRFDLAVANPPYLVDDGAALYRHGGDLLGAGLSLRIAREAAARLTEGGRLLLYTASAISGGRDGFREAVLPALRNEGCEAAYAEIDPDVWGEELDRPRLSIGGAHRRRRRHGREGKVSMTAIRAFETEQRLRKPSCIAQLSAFGRTRLTPTLAGRTGVPRSRTRPA